MAYKTIGVCRVMIYALISVKLELFICNVFGSASLMVNINLCTTGMPFDLLDVKLHRSLLTLWTCHFYASGMTIDGDKKPDKSPLAIGLAGSSENVNKFHPCER